MADFEEDVGKRQQHSKTFHNNQGGFQTLLSSNLHYKDAGEWKQQNYEFHQVDGKVQADRHWFKTVVDATGIDVDNPDTGVGLRWILDGQPTTVGSKAHLSIDGMEWDWEVMPKRVKMSGVVTASLGGKTYTFKYQPLGAGQDFQIVDGAAVTPGLIVERPYIIGANELFYATSGWLMLPNMRLQFTFDDTSLPAEAYPYVIDPTTTFRTTGVEDTKLQEGEGTDNFHTQTQSRLGDVSDSSSVNSRLLIRFDFIDIPASAIVSNGTLSWYDDSSQGNGAGVVSAYRVLPDWVVNEASDTNYKTGTAWPGSASAGTSGTDYYATASATKSLSGNGAYNDWDGNLLDTDCQNFVSGSQTNNGWLFIAANEDQGGAQGNSLINMTNHATETTRPKLVITYTLPVTPRVIMF